MHPWNHARSSARRYGGPPECYLTFHQWFDFTKITLAHFKHRLLRHHREGVEEACGIFGSTIAIENDKSVDAESLGLQHLSEDLGCAPFARDWLQHAEIDQLPSAYPASDILAEQSAARFGGSAEAFLPLHAWFLATENWMPDRRHLILRHHSFGVFEAEDRFGVVLQLPNGRSVPTRIAAERHVKCIMGSIPTASALLQMVRPQKWMAAATSPAKLGLDRPDQ